METISDVIWQRDGFGAAENLDGFARGVDDYPAIGATGEMFFEVYPNAGVEDPIEIAR
jgi:hypothetical protein